MLKIYGEPESPHEGARLRCMVNQIAKWGGGGMFNMCDEPESPNEGARFRCMIYRKCRIRGCLKRMRFRNPKKEGVLQIYDETLSPNGGRVKIYDEPLSPSLRTCTFIAK